MKSIHKYDLPMVGFATFDLPKGSGPHHVAFQRGHLRLWVEVDLDAEKVPHHFEIRMTGGEWAVRPIEVYVGTAMTEDGGYVVHVYQTRIGQP
jgi:hypothetical protein